MCSRQTLEAAWNKCYRDANEQLLGWWGRFDGILAEMAVIGIIKEGKEKKAKAMFLIGDEYATLAEYGEQRLLFTVSTSYVKKRQGHEALWGGERSAKG